MKRVVCVLVALVVLVAGTVPVMAAEDSSFIDAMALGSIQGTGNYSTHTSANGSLVFRFVTPLQVSYIDFTFRITGTAPTDMSVNGISSSIEFIKVTTDVYRCYGRLSSTSAISQLTFKLTSTATNVVTIVNASIGVSRYNTYETAGTLCWVDGSTRNQVASWAAGGTGQDTLSGTSGSTANWIRDYEVTLTDWEGADMIELLIKMENLSVGSIAGYMNSSQLPIEVDPIYVYDEGGSSNSTSEDGTYAGEESEDGVQYEDGSYDGYTYTEGDYWSTGSIKDYGFRGTRVYRVRIDLRSVNRYEQNDFNPIVRFCVIAPASVKSVFTIGSSRCFIDLDGIDGLALVGVWFKELGFIFQSYTESLGNIIGQGFDSVLDALTGQDTESSENFQQDAMTDTDEMDSMMDEMEQVTKPAVDDMDVGLDDYMTEESMDSIGTAFAPFFENQLILSMMLISATMALASYALFGKR